MDEHTIQQMLSANVYRVVGQAEYLKEQGESKGLRSLTLRYAYDKAHDLAEANPGKRFVIVKQEVLMAIEVKEIK